MPPNFRKPPVRNPPAFLPRPLLRTGNQPRQGESKTPDKLFPPAESALIIWILLEIVSNFVQQTPPKFGIQISAKNMVGAKRSLFRIPPAEPRIQKGFPRSAWLVVSQYKFMNNQTKKFFIYTRKSTDDKDRQVRSISDQLSELKELALKEQLEVVDVFVEKQTAKIPGRPVFNEMMLRMEAGEASGILAWHPDRLARNTVDGGKIIYLVDTEVIVEMKFPTFWFDPTPQGKFMLSIAFSQSKYYVDNLSENIKLGHRQKLRKGIWPGFAPLGYLNNSRTKSIDVDNEKSVLVKKCFELYGTGDNTLKNIKQFLADTGLDSYKGNVLSTSCIQRMLKNPFYYGTFRFNGELYEGSHEPIISKKLFDDVQQVMNNRGKKKRKRKYEFAFSGFMKCGKCGCLITAETQKGHIYYRCTKKKGPCQEKYFLRQEELYEQIKPFLQKVSLSSRDTEKVLAELNKEEMQAKEQAKINVQNLKAEFSEIEKKLEKLLDVYLEETIAAEEYTSRKEKLIKQKVGLKEQIQDFEQKGLSWLEPAREFVLSLNQAANLLSSQNKTEMTTFLKNIGSDCILQNRKLIFSPRIPYDLVAERSEATAPCLPFPVWWTWGELNPNLRNANALFCRLT